MESSNFVSDPIRGVFWPFKVDRRIYLTPTVGHFCLKHKFLLLKSLNKLMKCIQILFTDDKKWEKILQNSPTPPPTWTLQLTSVFILLCDYPDLLMFDNLYNLI